MTRMQGFIHFVSLFFFLSLKGAEFIVSNIEPSGSQINFRHSSWLAASFTTDNGQYTVDRLGVKGAVQTDSDDLFINVHGDTGGLPAGQIGAFAFDIVETDVDNGVVFFEPVGSIGLEGNTTYWMLFGESASSGGQGWINMLGSPSESGQWTIGDTSFASVNQGTTWSAIGSGNVLQFGINATPVPEPQHYTAVFGILLVSLIVFQRIGRNTC